MGTRDKLPDYFYVAAHQREIHKRLENWAQAQFSGGGSSASPMFRLYRTHNYERVATMPVDHNDAHKVAKGVAALPEPHRNALNWNYIEGGSPFQARKKIGVTLEGLMSLINDARQMLINRGV